MFSGSAIVKLHAKNGISFYLKLPKLHFAGFPFLRVKPRISTQKFRRNTGNKIPYFYGCLLRFKY
jgi:hypothetical protein